MTPDEEHVARLKSLEVERFRPTPPRPSPPVYAQPVTFEQGLANLRILGIAIGCDERNRRELEQEIRNRSRD